MKKLAILAVCALAILSSCKNEGPKQDLMMTQLRDSLDQIIAQKDNEINDMIATFGDIEEGFREITEAQSRVTLAKSGEGTNPAYTCAFGWSAPTQHPDEHRLRWR